MNGVIGSGSDVSELAPGTESGFHPLCGACRLSGDPSGLGWLGYRRSQIGEEDYYLAGRGQGWVVTSLTIMATFFSSFALLGAPGMVYREGVVFALVSLNVPVAGYCVYLLGSRIWEAGRMRGYVTPADMICDYYESGVALRLLVVLVGILFTIPYVMMQLKAGGEWQP